MSELRVFSDGLVSLPRRGIKAGRRMAPSPIDVPAEPVHAAEPASDVTLCGLAVDRLVEFPEQAFGDQNPRRRCPSCAAASGD